MHLKTAPIVVFWFYIGITDAGPCADGSKSVAQSLRNKLFCNYDPSVLPVMHHTNYTDVDMHMQLKFLTFDDHSNTFVVHCWMVFQWTDEHLKWDKSEYDDLDSLQVTTKDIWVPNVSLYDRSSTSDIESKIASTRCSLSSSGVVHCISPTAYSTFCTNTDFTRWPFDSQNCSVRVGSLGNNLFKIKLAATGRGITTSEYSENRDWELTKTTVNRHNWTIYNNESYLWVSYNFILARHRGGRAATVVIPALVLAMLALCVFWLEPHANERIFINLLDILVLRLYLEYLNLFLPSNGENTLIILTFYRDSLLMAGIALIITLAVRRMVVAKSEPPSWISTVVNGVLISHIGRVFLLGGVDTKSLVTTVDSDDASVAELVGSSGSSKIWLHFAVLLDRATFLIFILIYVNLLSAYI